MENSHAYSSSLNKNVNFTQLNVNGMTVNLFFTDTDESLQAKLIHLVQNQNQQICLGESFILG